MELPRFFHVMMEFYSFHMLGGSGDFITFIAFENPFCRL